MGSDILATYNLIIEKPSITFKFKENFKIDSKIPVHVKNVPFEIFAESIDPFVIEDNGYNYSSTGVRFYFKRKKLGLLIGSFYGPMAVFAALSMLSYNINVDAVSINYTNIFIYTYIYTEVVN